MKKKSDWEKEFDKDYENAAIIWPKAFIADAKKYGFKPEINLEYFKKQDLNFIRLKVFIRSLIQQARQEGIENLIKEMREIMDEYDYQIEDEAWESINIFLERKEGYEKEK